MPVVHIFQPMQSSVNITLEAESCVISIQAFKYKAIHDKLFFLVTNIANRFLEERNFLKVLKFVSFHHVLTMMRQIRAFLGTKAVLREEE